MADLKSNESNGTIMPIPDINQLSLSLNTATPSILMTNDTSKLPKLLIDNDTLTDPKDYEVRPYTELVYLANVSKLQYEVKPNKFSDPTDTTPKTIEELRAFTRIDCLDLLNACYSTTLDISDMGSNMCDPTFVLWSNLHCSFNVFAYKNNIYTTEEICKIIPFTEFGTIPEHFFNRTYLYVKLTSVSIPKLSVGVYDSRIAYDGQKYPTRLFVENEELSEFIEMCKRVKIMNRLRRSNEFLQSIEYKATSNTTTNTVSNTTEN